MPACLNVAKSVLEWHIVHLLMCLSDREQRSSNVMQFLWKSFSFALNSFFLNESKATGLFYKLFLLNNKTRNHCTGVKDIKGNIQSKRLDLYRVYSHSFLDAFTALGVTSPGKK